VGYERAEISPSNNQEAPNEVAVGDLVRQLKRPWTGSATHKPRQPRSAAGAPSPMFHPSATAAEISDTVRRQDLAGWRSRGAVRAGSDACGAGRAERWW